MRLSTIYDALYKSTHHLHHHHHRRSAGKLLHTRSLEAKSSRHRKCCVYAVQSMSYHRQKKVKVIVRVRKSTSRLQKITCHMEPHSVTCHPAAPLPLLELVLDLVTRKDTHKTPVAYSLLNSAIQAEGCKDELT